jgi:tRNA/tmRNA/rRNA uracil-C5-methylase (TrmA/RlmC/RlmD family)
VVLEGWNEHHTWHMAYCSYSQLEWTNNNQRNNIYGGEMKEKAVIDRFEGNLAVLLLKDGQQQLVVPRKSLPRWAKEGHWLQVEIENSEVHSAEIDKEETARVKERIAEKLARLRRGEHLR